MRRQRDPETLDEGSGRPHQRVTLICAQQSSCKRSLGRRRGERSGKVTMVVVGGLMFHTQRSLEEEGHVVCGEYREDWKRVGEGLVECDGSLSPLLWGNFPLFFFSPKKEKSHKRRSVADCHSGRCAGICCTWCTWCTLSTLYTHYIVVGSSSQLCGAPGGNINQALMSLQNREGLLWKTRASTSLFST